jgi:hypothetical protein
VRCHAPSESGQIANSGQQGFRQFCAWSLQIVLPTDFGQTLRNGAGGCSGQKRSGRGYLPEESGFKREEAVFGLKTFFVTGLSGSVGNR